MRHFPACLLLIAAAQSHALTALDSGWTPVWNGADFSQLQQYDGGANGKFRGDPTSLGIFKIEAGGVIHGSNTSYSLLMTKASYNCYKLRVDYRFDPGIAKGVGNAGM